MNKNTKLHPHGCDGPMLALDNASGHGKWTCYSPSTLDPANKSFVRGNCYCSDNAELKAVLDQCVEPTPSPTPDPDHPFVNAFVSGQDGYHTYRIPALVLVPGTAGELLLFAEGRKFSSADHDWNDIVMKRSLDSGETWGAMQIIHSESTAANHVTIGNPAPIALLSNPGSVILLGCRNNTDVFSMTSVDGGSTWSNANYFTNQVCTQFRVVCCGSGM